MTDKSSPEVLLPTLKRRKPSYLILMLYLASVIVVVLSASYILYVHIYNEDGVITFVPAHLTVDKETLTLACLREYIPSKESFSDCLPRRCTRVVMDTLVTDSEARHLRGMAQRSLALSEGKGGTSVFDLRTGKLKKGNDFIDIYNSTEERFANIFTEEDFAVYSKVKTKIHDAIAEEFGIKPTSLYLAQPTFFSSMNTNPAITIMDQYWHPHVDRVFHYTSLLYLSTYGQDFLGGRFIYVDKDANRTVEPRLGRVSFFASGYENTHFVEKLKAGERLAITISFTCNPRLAIEDPVLPSIL